MNFQRLGTFLTVNFCQLWQVTIPWLLQGGNRELAFLLSRGMTHFSFQKESVGTKTRRNSSLFFTTFIIKGNVFLCEGKVGSADPFFCKEGEDESSSSTGHFLTREGAEWKGNNNSSTSCWVRFSFAANFRILKRPRSNWSVGFIQFFCLGKQCVRNTIHENRTTHRFWSFARKSILTSTDFQVVLWDEKLN